MANSDVFIRLRLIDEASSGFRRLEQQTRQLQHDMSQNAARAAREASRAATRGHDDHIRAYQRINDARQTLGVRGHGQIRAEIDRTRAAYRTLAASGTLSFREQAQAADRMRQSVRSLTNEMGHLTTAQRGMRGLQFGGMVAGGAIGAGAAMRGDVVKAMDFDKHMAYMANTGFDERDTRGRAVGAKQLEAAVHKSVAESGGGADADSVRILLDKLISGGELGANGSIAALPSLAKTMAANNIDPTDMGSLVNKLRQSGYVKNSDDFARAMNIIVAGGNAGGFEIKDMAKYLPEQIGVGKTAGLTGLAGLQKIVTMNEAAMVTAGTPDIAGRNTFNYLSKLSSADTAKDYERAGLGNLGQDLVEARAKGIDAIDFWQNVINGQVQGTPYINRLKAQLAPGYKAGANDLGKEEIQSLISGAESTQKITAGLLEKLAQTTDKNQQASILEGVNELLKGNVIVKSFQDAQAKSALQGMQNFAFVKKVADKVARGNVVANGPSDRNFEPLYQTSAFKVSAAKNMVEGGQKHIIDSLTPAIGRLSDAILTLSGNHPAVGAAVAAAPWVGGAALGVGGMALLSRGTRIIPGAISLASSFLSRAPAISAAATRYAAPAIRAAAPVVAASPVGRVAGVGMAAYAGGTLLADAINAVISKIKGQETTLGSAIYDLINYEPKPVKVDPIQVTTTSTVQVGLAAGLVPLGQSSSSTSNKPAGTNTSSIMKTNTGNLWLGAPG